jgi:CheY-like chemotaxis protein
VSEPLPGASDTEGSSLGDGDPLAFLLESKIVGQRSALATIVPSIHLHRSGLAPTDRPVGAFLLLGPTGTGKTRTVEAIAEVLHGHRDAVLRVDCGEFQSDHEIAKLIGAPPGYVGHLDSKPRLTSQSVEEVRSPRCDLALVLFDEVEKAAPSLSQLLLSILDRGKLRLGSGEEVDFTRTLIFFTSNLGAREMMDAIRPTMGFDAGRERSPEDLKERLEGIGLRAVQKHFPPEFVNRLDGIVTYRPLDPSSVVAILEHHIAELKEHVHSRLGARSFDLEIAPAARYFMIDKGTSLEYGARELRRVIHKHLTQPLAVKVANGFIKAGASVTVDLADGGEGLVFRVREEDVSVPAARRRALVVDDNGDLLHWMKRVLSYHGWEVVLATSAQEAGRELATARPDAAILEYVLPDGDGVGLARTLLEESPDVQVIITSGVDLDPEDALVCEAHGFPVLVKPFLSEELLAALGDGSGGEVKAMAEGA